MSEARLKEIAEFKQKEKVLSLQLEIENLKNHDIKFAEEVTQKIDEDSEKFAGEKELLDLKLIEATEDSHQLKIELDDVEQRWYKMFTNYDMAYQKHEDFKNKIEPSVKEIAACREAIPKLQSQLDTTTKHLEHLIKQLHLIRELRNFNIEELKMINNAMTTLLKKWEEIERSQVPQ